VTGTSLVEAAAADKARIESWIPDRNSPYWRGEPGGLTAGQVQGHYRDLIRGELAGARMPVGPEHGEDLDLPRDAQGYRLEGLPLREDDFPIVERFLPVAFECGLGQQKVYAFSNGCCTTPGGRRRSSSSRRRSGNGLAAAAGRTARSGWFLRG
jgi:hypothetical protein